MSERERVGGVVRGLERPILLPEMHKIQRMVKIYRSIRLATMHRANK
jgi:hypothetical protein